MNADDADIAAQCRLAVDRLMRRYDWRLLDSDELVQRTIALIRVNAAPNAHYAAFGAYHQALYDACSGAEGIDRWELGYTELFHMLYNRARKHYPDVCHDATQLALEKICSRLDRCREPRAFFTFAVQQLMNAARDCRRQESRQPLSLEMSVGEENETLDTLLSDDSANPLDILLGSELRMRVREFIDAYLRKHDRAHNQLAALLLSEFEQMGDEAIAEALHVPKTAVPSLRSRARERLRNDAELRRLATDLGIIPDEPEE